MKQKAGVDYIQLNNCVAQVLINGNVRLSTMGETIELTQEEMRKLVKFVQGKETS